MIAEQGIQSSKRLMHAATNGFARVDVARTTRLHARYARRVVAAIHYLAFDKFRYDARRTGVSNER